MPNLLSSLCPLLCITWAPLCWHVSGQGVLTSCGTTFLTLVDNAKHPYCHECTIPGNTNCVGVNVAVGTHCTTLCQEGYTASPATITCTSIGLSPKTYECIPQPCQGAGIAYALSPPCLGGVPVPHEGNCTLECIAGFKSRKDLYDCYASKLLPTPVCDGLPCAAPVGIEHAMTASCRGNRSTVGHDDHCYAACLPGYISNVTRLHCFGAQLTPPSFSCTPAACLVPDIKFSPASPCAEGGSIIPHGGYCTPRCLFGFVSTSTDPLQCSLGSFSPASWQCMPLPCPAFPGSTIYAGAPTTCSEGSMIPHDGTCTSQCQDGFLPNKPLKCYYGAFYPKTNCSMMACPSHLVLVDNAENLYCQLPWCSMFDVDTCCRPTTTTTRTTLSTTTSTSSTTSTTSTSTVTTTVSCRDTDDGNTDSFGGRCSNYYQNLNWCNNFDTASFDSSTMCCACGGGDKSVDVVTTTTTNMTTFTTTRNITALGDTPVIRLHYMDDDQNFEFQALSHRRMENGVQGWLDEPYTYDNIPAELLDATIFDGPFFLNTSFTMPEAVGCGSCPAVLPRPANAQEALETLFKCSLADIIFRGGTYYYDAVDAGIEKYGWAVQKFGWTLHSVGEEFRQWNYPSSWPSARKTVAYKALWEALLADPTTHVPACAQAENRTIIPGTQPFMTLKSPATVVMYIWSEVGHRDGGIKSLNWTSVGTMYMVDPENATLEIYKATFSPTERKKINFPTKDWVGGVAMRTVPVAFYCIPQPCDVPSIVNASDPACVEGDTIPHGGSCNAHCLIGFAPTIATMSCNASRLSPATFACLGAPCNALTTVQYAAWPSCTEGIQVDHFSTCTPVCQIGYVATLTSLQCAYSKLTPATFYCIELPCFPPGTSTNEAFDVCSVGKVGGAAKINAGTSWYISMAPLGDNRQAVCYEDVSSQQRYSYCGVLIATGTTLIKPAILAQISHGRATDIVLTSFGSDQVLMCYRSYAQANAGVCRVLATGAVLSSITGFSGANDYRELHVGPELVVHDGATWRLAAAPIAKQDKAVVCYQHTYVSCRILSVTGVLSTGVELSGSAPISLGTTSVVYISLAPLGVNRAVVCVADAMDGELGMCSVLVANATKLIKGKSYPMSDGAVAHMAVAPLVEDFAMVCFADWSQSEHGKCRILKVSGQAIAWGKMFNITYQASTTVRKLIPGVTRFMALAQLPSVGQQDLLWTSGSSVNESIMSSAINVEGTNESESLASGMGAVACFQVSSTVQDRHGYCKVIRLTGLADLDLNASAELILNPGTAWNFAVAPLSTGKVAVCFSDSSESEHAHCIALVPGLGHNTWKD